MAHVSVTNRRFSVKYATVYAGNSTVGHKFFVTGGVKREMDIADINGAYAILSKCISPFLHRGERASARDLSIAIDEKKRQGERDRRRERERTRRFYLFKSSRRGFRARAHCGIQTESKPIDLAGRPARFARDKRARRLLFYSRARNAGTV